MDQHVIFQRRPVFFTDVNLVAVIGDDFPQEHIDFLESRNVDLAGLQKTEGQTFRWKGRYDYDLNEAHTLETHLNVFETFKPSIPENYRDAEYVFLPISILNCSWKCFSRLIIRNSSLAIR